MTTVLVFLVVLSVLIVIHELGHFVTAKAFGIRVEEFALGFPPRIASIVRGETRYSLNAIPLGGYVKLTGEEDPSDPRSLASRSIAVRATVITAGVFMNFLLTILLFSIFFTFPAEMVGTRLEVDSVVPGSPAEGAGLMPGDVILRTGSDVAVERTRDLTEYTQANLGREISLLVRRDSDTLLVRLVPRRNPPPGEGAMGIAVRATGGRLETRFSPSLSVIPESFEQVGSFLTSFSTIFTSEGREGVAGPIGIAQVTGEIARSGILPLIGFTGLLSLNLALLNILPIPALDGGRLLFVIIEAIRGGKRIPPEKEALIHMMGFVTLIGFIVFISVGDVRRIISGDSLLP
ncbi:MAG: M50 family metallopeptidase [Dehalococcoidia bacterium]